MKEQKEMKNIPIDILDRVKKDLDEKGQYFVKQSIENYLRIKQEKILKKMESNNNKILGKEDAKGNVKGGLNSKAYNLVDEKEQSMSEGTFDNRRKKNYMANLQLILIEKERIEIDNKILSKEYKLNSEILGDKLDEDSPIILSSKEDRTIDVGINDTDNTDDEDEDIGKDTIIDEDTGEEINAAEILGTENIINNERRKDVELKDVSMKISNSKDE